MKSIICFVAMLVTMMTLSLSLLTGNLVLQVYLKALASILFVCAGLFAARERRSGSSYVRFILLGLIFGCVGDISMQISDIKGELYFIIGLVTFALGHVFYLVAFFKKSSFRWYNLILTLLVIPAAIVGIPLSQAFEFNPGFLFFAVIAYGVIMTFMVGKSLSFVEFKGHPRFVQMTIIGAILFGISDIILLFILFFKPVSSLAQFDPFLLMLRMVGLVTYYVGQGLIALSLKKEP